MQEVDKLEEYIKKVYKNPEKDAALLSASLREIMKAFTINVIQRHKVTIMADLGWELKMFLNVYLEN
jgi:aspartate aminotransferase-like enzyme